MRTSAETVATARADHYAQVALAPDGLHVRVGWHAIDVQLVVRILTGDELVRAVAAKAAAAARVATAISAVMVSEGFIGVSADSGELPQHTA